MKRKEATRPRSWERGHRPPSIHRPPARKIWNIGIVPWEQGGRCLAVPEGIGDDDLRPDPSPVDPDDLPFLEDELDYPLFSSPNRQNTPGLQ